MDLIIFFLILAIDFFIAVACAVTAGRKNRSAVGWFFIGIFTSFIGLFVVLFLPPLVSYVQEGARRASRCKQIATTKTCEFCGEIILKVAKKCKHCGEFVKEVRLENKHRAKIEAWSQMGD